MLYTFRMLVQRDFWHWALCPCSYCYCTYGYCYCDCNCISFMASKVHPAPISFCARGVCCWHANVAMSHPANELGSGTLFYPSFPQLNNSTMGQFRPHLKPALGLMLTQQIAEVQAVFEYNQKNFKYDREMRQAGQWH